MNQSFPIPAPIGTNYDYIMTQRHGRILLVAGQLAKTGLNVLHATGRCGAEVDLPTAKAIGTRSTMRKARVALARRLATIMHAMMRDETEFQAA